MWWLSAHWGLRAGCRLRSHPRTPQDTFSRTRAFLLSPLTKLKLGFTTTRERAPSVQWPPSTQQRKVWFFSVVSQIIFSLNSKKCSTLALHQWLQIANESIDWSDFNYPSFSNHHFKQKLLQSNTGNVVSYGLSLKSYFQTPLKALKT